jgi:hypothetical protein
VSTRQILTPDLALPVPVATGETVALSAGRGWGTRATLACAGACTVKGYASPMAEGGDVNVTAAGTVTFELRGPDNPRWTAV